MPDLTRLPPWTRAALALFVVGWGANQFAALLPVYRIEGGATDGQVTALFGAYAIGLVPALLLVAPVSDRIGRRRVLRPVLVLSFIATVVLMVGGSNLTVLLIGRLLAGIASGAAFAPGTAWVKELTTGPAGPGARRAAIALSSGFATGPLVAGLFAQWAPAATVLPYVPHLVLTVAIAIIMWNATEPPLARVKGTHTEASRVRHALTRPRFLLQVVPTAPWVFGGASLAFTTVPAIVDVPGPEIAVGGALVALTLGTGVALQPLARRLTITTTLMLGVTSGVLGLLLGAVAAETGAGWLAAPIAVLLGVAYGFILVGGLRTVEEVAAPADLGMVNAVFYSLTYIGFAAPFLGTILLGALDGPGTMLLLAAVLAASIPLVIGGSQNRVRP
ncbi:MFS transporter [Aeromicrobium sp. CF3.5]|uniref:MFS transporter n=1 Tax=Aeromicrobium sp. CF3.5 TaxID=3373078 RepID=UPI003EE4F1B3